MPPCSASEGRFPCGTMAGSEKFSVFPASNANLGQHGPNLPFSSAQHAHGQSGQRLNRPADVVHHDHFLSKKGCHQRRGARDHLCGSDIALPALVMLD